MALTVSVCLRLSHILVSARTESDPPPMKPFRLFADAALLPQGWAERVLIEIGADGVIAAVTSGGEAGGAERAAGPVLPAMPNLHSHAFQRAMAGRAERAGASQEDSFWTWRQVMYGFVARLDPDALE